MGSSLHERCPVRELEDARATADSKHSEADRDSGGKVGCGRRAARVRAQGLEVLRLRWGGKRRPDGIPRWAR
nr:unnamed protein product [Digitaria exilis]